MSWKPAERPAGLTEGEYAIAAAAAMGWSLRRVALEVNWSYASVKVYLTTKIYPKLGIHSQPELVRWWITNVENRGDCSACTLRQAHLAGDQLVQL